MHFFKIYKVLGLIFILANCLILINGSHLRQRQTQLTTKTKTNMHNKDFLRIPMQRKPHPSHKLTKLSYILREGQHSLRNHTNSTIQKKLIKQSWSNTPSSQSNLVRISLQNYLDTQYSGQIAIGNNNRKLTVIFDTGNSPYQYNSNRLGSTLLWINSIRCTIFECINHTQYDYSESIHWSPIMEDKLYSTQFGSGRFHGVISQDWVYLDDLIVKSFKFAEIVSQEQILDDANFDGVMGLGFPDNEGEYGMLGSVIDAIQSQHLLEHNMFSFSLKRQIDSDDSVIIFGGYDSNLLQPPIAWSKVVSDKYWMIQGDNILVDGVDIGLCQGGCYFILDTGTSIMTGPATQLDYLLRNIGVANQCQNYYDLPDISFIMQGISFVLTPIDYVISIGQSGPFPAYSEPNVADIIDCISVFYPLNLPKQQNGNVWVLGDTFISKFYTIYDLDNLSIGIAYQNDQED